MRGFSQEMLPPGFDFASTAILAPGAKQVRESLAKNENAIGFLPQKWMDASVKEVPWLDTTSGSGQLPILAYTDNHFDEQLSAWLVCVQNLID